MKGSELVGSYMMRQQTVLSMAGSRTEQTMPVFDNGVALVVKKNRLE